MPNPESKDVCEPAFFAAKRAKCDMIRWLFQNVPQYCTENGISIFVSEVMEGFFDATNLEPEHRLSVLNTLMKLVGNSFKFTRCMQSYLDTRHDTLFIEWAIEHGIYFSPDVIIQTDEKSFSS